MDYDIKFIEYLKRAMLRRVTREYEYNRALLFLISNTSYMTRASLIIGGGYTAW